MHQVIVSNWSWYGRLTGFLCVVASASVLQLVIAVCMMLFFIRQYSYYHPYVDESISSLKTFTQWQIYVVYFIALLLRTDAFDSYNYDVALSVILVFTVVANLLLEVYQHAVLRSGLFSPASLTEAELDESNASDPMQTLAAAEHGASEEEASFKEDGIRMAVMSYSKGERQDAQFV